MATATTYNILIDYKLNDRASGGLKSIGNAAGETSGILTGLKTLLGGIAAGFTMKKAFDGLVGYNVEMESMQTRMAAILNMNMGMPFERATRAASGLVLKMQELARHSPGTTKDYMGVAAGIASAVGQAGGGTEDLLKLTEMGVTSGMLYGKLQSGGETTGASTSMSELLLGRVRVTNPMARSLLAAGGYRDHMKWNEFAREHMADGGTLKEVERMANLEGLRKGKERLSHTTSGEWSTFEDNKAIIMGRAGSALTSELTKELRSLNEWVDRNPKKIQEFIDNLSSALTTGFGYMKSAVQFLWDHRSMFVDIGKLFLGMKAINGIGGLIGAGSGLAKTLSAGGLAGLASGLTSATSALFAFGSTMVLLVNMLDEYQARTLKDRNGTDGSADLGEQIIKGGMTAGRRAATVKVAWLVAHEEGLIGADGKFDQNKFLDSRGRDQYSKNTVSGGNLFWGALAARAIDGKMSKDDANLVQLYGGGKGFEEGFAGGKDNPMFAAVRSMAGELIAIDEQMLLELRKMNVGNVPTAMIRIVDTMTDMLDFMGFGKTTDGANVGGKPPVNVTIQKIEVASEDPDRFVYGLVNTFEDIARNPTQAANATRNFGT